MPNPFPRHTSTILQFNNCQSLHLTCIQWSNNYTLISLSLAPKAHNLGFIFQVKAHQLSTELLLDVQSRLFSADSEVEAALHAFIYKIFPVLLEKGFLAKEDAVLVSLNFPMEVLRDPSLLLCPAIE